MERHLAKGQSRGDGGQFEDSFDSLIQKAIDSEKIGNRKFSGGIYDEVERND